MSTIGPIALHQALAGLDFPASKKQILAHLDQSEGESAGLVLSQVEEMPDGTYQDLNEVDSAVANAAY